MAEMPEDFDLRWELLVADAWDDPQLKDRLLKDPGAVFAERGMDLPAGTTVSVHEDTESETNLVLPPPPTEEELSEEELETVAGGGSLCFSLCIGGCGRGGCGGCRRCGGCGGCGCRRCGCGGGCGCRRCGGCGGCGGCRRCGCGGRRCGP